jgi:hypothetical protein
MCICLNCGAKVKVLMIQEAFLARSAIRRSKLQEDED